MGAIVSYFRIHPWQRRVLTAMVAITFGFIVAVIVFPHFRDYLIIRDMGSSDEATRTEAMERAVYLAGRDERFRSRLYDALGADSDVQFVSIMKVLGSLKNAPYLEVLHFDRMRSIQLIRNNTTDNDFICERILREIIISGRDNRFVREALETASTHPSPGVRILAGMLAASLEDDETLEKLLADKDNAVVGAAALDAGLAGRGKLAAKIKNLLITAESPTIVSDAAYAVALLDADSAGPEICKRLAATKDDLLRDRLLHVASLLDSDEVRKIVLEVLESTQKAGKHPSAAAILAAGKLGIKQADSYVLAVLREVTSKDVKLHESHMLAAIDAAERLDLTVSKELLQLIPCMWAYEVTSVRAVRLLFKQVSKLPVSDPLRKDAAKLLGRAASSGGQVGGTALLPSAAAAVALWKLNKDPEDKAVRGLSRSDTLVPGDYVSWYLSLAEPDRAFDLGMRMLPPPLERGVPQEDQPPRVYNANERCCGAMLLALSARSPQQKADAIARIQLRMDKTLITTSVERGTLNCALLILNSPQGSRQQAFGSLMSGVFPEKRAMTALLAVGDKESLDWLLLSDISHKDSHHLLIAYEVEVLLKAAVPELPEIDVAAEDNLAMWQLKILRHAYAIKRNSLEPGLRQ